MRNHHQHRFYFLVFLVAIFLFLVSCGIRTRTHIPRLDQYLNNTFEGTGVVVEEPEEKSFYTELIVKVSGSKRTQKILVQAPFYPDFEYGDEVSIRGKLKYPKDFITDSGRTFPYQKFLAKDDIYYILSSPTIVLVSKHKGNPIKHFLFGIKNSFVIQIGKILPRPESSLLSGMLISGKGGLGSALEANFKDVGLIHIVVLSGYNVTIVAEAFIKMLWFLPRIFAHGAGIVGIILFAVMAGGGSTIIRASFMSIVAVFAKITGETYSALKALTVGGVVMVTLNPLTLFYDPSFHLSFMTTFALILFSTPIQKRLGRFGQTVFGETVSSTLAVELLLLPYLLWMNGSFAPISFPANLLVISYIPFTMLAGFAATIASYFYLPLAQPFSAVAFVMLRYVLRIVEIAAHFTGLAIKL